MATEDYLKTRIAIKYWLHGRRYLMAAAAMQFALTHHVGTRRDRTTPEFQHQVSQANRAVALEPFMLLPEETFATIFLHDVVEDYDVPLSQIADMFGARVAHSVELMTNKHPNGDKKDEASYYSAMGGDEIASLCKGLDRLHNQQSMIDVFTREKQVRYIAQTRDHILPMLKAARKKFVAQSPAYEEVKYSLQTQIELIEAVHRAATVAAADGGT